MRKIALISILVLAVTVSGCGLLLKRAPDITVTKNHHNKTITLEKFQRINVQVDHGYYWFNFVGSPAILKQVVPANEVTTNQGIYQGALAGTTFLDMRGEALCRTDPIPCTQKDLHYRFTINVLEAP